MINELLSNSFKHAFNADQKGVIHLAISSLNSSEFSMTYSDTGTWQENETQEERFGMELIRTLTEQMEGTMNRAGSEYTFRLKNLDV
jgi:two-component sensor histidine kinase